MQQRFTPATTLALAITLVCWASAFAGIRAGLEAYSPGHLALLRFLVASAALVPLAAYFRLPLPRLADVPHILLHGFLGYFGYHVCLNIGEQTVSAGSACFIIGFIPVFSVLLAALLLAEPLTRRVLAGIGVSVCGIGLIAWAEGGGAAFDTGALWVLAAALSESLFFVLQKPKLDVYRAVHYTIYAMWGGTLPMLLFLPGLGEAVAAAPAPATWAVVYLGIFPSAIAYATWTFAISRLPVGKVIVTQYAMPLMTVAIAWVWLGELPAPMAFAGGLLALLGVFVGTRPPKRPPRRAESAHSP
ncbi:DMT family transporter [Desulfohalovibrio reitneri]|uniref:DMT family transporter n=1 Tax=Desulfohalovibrio reitneri TaxID=1307759 RepID=UPI0004A785F2|nr:DMT family transporter [Desulfohalovibrio reitneri]